MAKLNDEIKKSIRERVALTDNLARALLKRHKHMNLPAETWWDIAESVIVMGFTNGAPGEQSVVPDPEPENVPVKRVRKRPSFKATPDNVVTNQNVVKSMAEKELEELEPLIDAMESEAAVRRAESKRMEKIKVAEEAKAAEGSEEWVKNEVKKGPKVFKRPNISNMTAEERELLRKKNWRKKINHTFLETLGKSLAGKITDRQQLNLFGTSGGLKYGFPGTEYTNDGHFISYECLIDEHGALYLSGVPWLGEKNIVDGKPLIPIPHDLGNVTPRRSASFGITLWVDTRTHKDSVDGEVHLKRVQAYAKAFADYVQEVAWHGLPPKEFLSNAAVKHYGKISIRTNIATTEIEDVFRVNNSASPLGTALVEYPRTKAEVDADPKVSTPFEDVLDGIASAFVPVTDAIASIGKQFMATPVNTPKISVAMDARALDAQMDAQINTMRRALDSTKYRL